MSKQKSRQTHRSLRSKSKVRTKTKALRPWTLDLGPWTINETEAGQAAAARPVSLSISWALERKVRAPQDTVVGNAHRPQGPGKCNRKQTARRGTGDSSPVPRRVRVKRCGKSAPAGQATGLARQTPPGARPRRKNDGQPSRAGPARKSFRVGRLRRRATVALEKWPLSTEPGLSARFGFHGRPKPLVSSHGRSSLRGSHATVPASPKKRFVVSIPPTWQVGRHQQSKKRCVACVRI
jgi:hypothetical protein